MSKKSLMVAAAIATLGVGGALGVNGVVNAATDTSAPGDPASSLVQKIADKFNLNKADVQAVFDEQRDEMETKHEQAVKDGTITQDQADKILAKLQEMKSQRDSLKDKSADERRQSMQQNRDDMKQWASDNGISLDTLRDILGKPGGMRGGPGPDEAAPSS